jgi:hypothetical protein
MMFSTYPPVRLYISHRLALLLAFEYPYGCISFLHIEEVVSNPYFLIVVTFEIPVVATSIVAITTDLGGANESSWLLTSYLLGYVG